MVGVSNIKVLVIAIILALVGPIVEAMPDGPATADLVEERGITYSIRGSTASAKTKMQERARELHGSDGHGHNWNIDDSEDNRLWWDSYYDYGGSEEEEAEAAAAAEEEEDDDGLTDEEAAEIASFPYDGVRTNECFYCAGLLEIATIGGGYPDRHSCETQCRTLSDPYGTNLGGANIYFTCKSLCKDYVLYFQENLATYGPIQACSTVLGRLTNDTFCPGQ